MDRNDYPDEDGNENGLDIIGRRAHLTFHPARSGAPVPPLQLSDPMRSKMMMGWYFSLAEICAPISV